MVSSCLVTIWAFGAQASSLACNGGSLRSNRRRSPKVWREKLGGSSNEASPSSLVALVFHISEPSGWCWSVLRWFLAGNLLNALAPVCSRPKFIQLLCKGIESSYQESMLLSSVGWFFPLGIAPSDVFPFLFARPMSWIMELRLDIKRKPPKEVQVHSYSSYSSFLFNCLKFKGLSTFSVCR